MLRTIERSVGYHTNGMVFETQEEAYKAIYLQELRHVVDELNLSPSDHLDKSKLTGALWAQRRALLEALQMPITVKDRAGAQGY